MATNVDLDSYPVSNNYEEYSSGSDVSHSSLFLMDSSSESGIDENIEISEGALDQNHNSNNKSILSPAKMFSKNLTIDTVNLSKSMPGSPFGSKSPQAKSSPVPSLQMKFNGSTTVPSSPSKAQGN